MSYALIFFSIDYQNQLTNFEFIQQLLLFFFNLLLVYAFIVCDSTEINLHDDNREYNYFLVCFQNGWNSKIFSSADDRENAFHRLDRGKRIIHSYSNNRSKHIINKISLPCLTNYLMCYLSFYMVQDSLGLSGSPASFVDSDLFPTSSGSSRIPD